MSRNRILGALCVGLCLALAARVLAEKVKPVATFSASAVSLGTGRASIVNMTVNRWSTDEEREMLLTTLQEFGTDKLVDALQKIRPSVGFMRTPNSRGYTLYYARNLPNPDGSRRVVLATDRPVAFGEAANSTRSMNYRVTLIEMHIGADGKGEGKMVPAARISWNKDAKKLEIENYGALPVDFISVTAKTPS